MSECLHIPTLKFVLDIIDDVISDEFSNYSSELESAKASIEYYLPKKEIEQ